MRQIIPYKTRTGAEIYLHKETGSELNRIVGAIGWPKFPNPGGLVVVGEEWRLDPRLAKRRFYLLVEREKETLDDLHRTVREIGLSYAVPEWLADTEDRAMLRHFDKLDDDMDVMTLIFQAPYSEHNPPLSEYYQVFNELLHEDHKTLFLGENSKVSAYLDTIEPEDTQKRTKDWPLIAALGYAIGQLLIEETPKSEYYYPKPKDLMGGGKSEIGGY